MTKMVDEVIKQEWIDEAKKNGISLDILRHRLLTADWHIEDAISTPKGHRNKYGEYVRIAKENGIKRCTFYNRIYKGYTPEEACSSRMYQKKYDHADDLYIYADQAVKNGIHRATFWSRIYRGADPVKASTIPARKKGGNTRHESSFI